MSAEHPHVRHRLLGIGAGHGVADRRHHRRRRRPRCARPGPSARRTSASRPSPGWTAGRPAARCRARGRARARRRRRRRRPAPTSATENGRPIGSWPGQNRSANERLTTATNCEVCVSPVSTPRPCSSGMRHRREVLGRDEAHARRSRASSGAAVSRRDHLPDAAAHHHRQEARVGGARHPGHARARRAAPGRRTARAGRPARTSATAARCGPSARPRRGNRDRRPARATAPAGTARRRPAGRPPPPLRRSRTPTAAARRRAAGDAGAVSAGRRLRGPRPMRQAGTRPKPRPVSSVASRGHGQHPQVGRRRRGNRQRRRHQRGDARDRRPRQRRHRAGRRRPTAPGSR